LKYLQINWQKKQRVRLLIEEINMARRTVLTMILACVFALTWTVFGETQHDKEEAEVSLEGTRTLL
jgi:hypothetical protein